VATVPRRPLTVVVAAFLAVVLAAPAGPALAAGPGEPTRLLVTFAAPVDGPAELAGIRTASVLEEPGARSAVQVLEFPSPTEAARVARELAGRDEVVSVEPDRPLTLLDTDYHVLDVEVTDDAASATTDVTTTDVTTTSTVADGSWGVRNTGQSIRGVAGHAGIDVGAPLVWPQTTGRGIVVAVVDSGVDIDHPLLRDRIWRNPAETVNGLDDDGNGFVDDVNGWNFVDGDNDVYKDPNIDGHGTHVAGIIAAKPAPEYGLESVAPGASIMPLRFIGGESGTTSDAIAAMRYAEANGADLINASWGGTDPSPALRTAMSELTIPVVVSAGNLGHLGDGQVVYPAAYGLPGVISVAALDNTGAMASYSSTDRDLVDVAAPGSHILSTFTESRLAQVSGTSQAAPHVTGVLALALERHANLNLDAATLAKLVRDNVRPLSTATDTRAAGLVRAPALLDALGTRVPACPTIATVPFTDVTEGGAHHDSVACMLARGVTKGTSATTYGSADDLTRAQIATLLANALAPTGVLPAPPAVERFSDTAGSIHRDSIEVLASIGIVRAISGDRYEPGRTVSRAEFAAVVTRAEEWLAGGEVRALGPGFTDTIGHVEAASIDAAAGLRIVTGRSAGIFDPDALLRRDQAASMVTRLLDRLVQHALLDQG